jgi:ElaB/YqjD/DUF883 family membrane-anchored ribosome-binding protein
MESNKSDASNTSNNTDAKAAAENLARHAGTSARNVGEAARSAGQRVGTVASEEMANLRADLDDLISRIPSLSDIDLEEAKQKLMDRVASTREAARDMADDARQQFDEGVECSRHYVQEHPLQSVGYGAAIGFLVGLLITRR